MCVNKAECPYLEDEGKSGCRSTVTTPLKLSALGSRSELTGEWTGAGAGAWAGAGAGAGAGGEGWRAWLGRDVGDSAAPSLPMNKKWKRSQRCLMMHLEYCTLYTSLSLY